LLLQQIDGIWIEHKLVIQTHHRINGIALLQIDRFQVIVSVDSTELATPSKKATVNGAGPLARETARRIACDCSVTTIHKTNGEPVDIGRRSRLWPAAMARAIKDRDQHCQFYGCTQTKNLQIHHIEHWADGGKTCVENGACLCQYHHTMVHECGYRIEAVAGSEQWLVRQFSAQRHEDDLGMFSVEVDLRNDEVSFDWVRGLSPTRYRFCVLDSEGRDLKDRRVTFNDNIHAHSIRVEWGK
jgi:hypothetical protein